MVSFEQDFHIIKIYSNTIRIQFFFKFKLMSKYHNLSLEEKKFLFNPPYKDDNVKISEIDLSFLKRTQKLYDFLEKFILDNGGDGEPGNPLWFSTPHDNLKIGDTKHLISMISNYEHEIKYESSKKVFINNKLDWSGNIHDKINYDTFFAKDRTYDEDVKWISSERVGLHGRKLISNPKSTICITLDRSDLCLMNFRITIIKPIQERKGWFSFFKKNWCQILELCPFFDNYLSFVKDSPEKYHLLKDFYEQPLDFWKFMENKNYNNCILDGGEDGLESKDIEILKDLYKKLDKCIDDVYNDSIVKPKLEKKKEKKSVQTKIKKIILDDLDKNRNGELDVIEGDNLLIDLLEKNESEIIKFDHNMIKDIMKLNDFLNTKRQNLEKIFELLKTIETNTEMDNLLETLKLSIDNYQSLLFHSLNMIVSVKEKKLSTYYEIRMCFDKLNVFNSNWENEVSEKLNQLDLKLNLVIISLNNINSSILSLENTIKTGLDKLTYTTKSSFKSLKSSLVGELKSIRSGVGLNNLLTGINTYQLYTLNKNTKSLRS